MQVLKIKIFFIACLSFSYSVNAEYKGKNIIINSGIVSIEKNQNWYSISGAGGRVGSPQDTQCQAEPALGMLSPCELTEVLLFRTWEFRTLPPSYPQIVVFCYSVLEAIFLKKLCQMGSQGRPTNHQKSKIIKT